MGSVNAAQRPGATGPAPSNVHHSQPLPKTAHPLHVTIGNLGTPGHERGQTPTTCFKTTLRLREERPAAHHHDTPTITHLTLVSLDRRRLP